MIIELTLFPGRTKEQKGKAIKAITSRLESSLGIAPTDVFIVIKEPPFENWGRGECRKGEKRYEQIRTTLEMDMRTELRSLIK